MRRPLRISMIGQRVLPATMGGVERHVEELGARLAERGHEVTAFVRARAGDRPTPSTYRGIRLVRVGSVRSKHLEALSHSVLSAARSRSDDVDIVHFHSIGPGLAAPLIRWGAAAKVVLTVHGFDDQRAKWLGPARIPLRVARWMSRVVPDVTIADAAWMADVYRAAGCDAHHVRNGVSPLAAETAEARRLAAPERTAAPTVLFVGRLVPEKRPDVLIRAFASVPGDARLVVVGAGSYTDSYVRSLSRLAAADRRVILSGAEYGADLARRWIDATVFCLPSDVEGLPLAMLDAASIGLPIVASDIPAHREIVQSSGPGHLLVPVGSVDELAAALVRTLDQRDAADRGAAALGSRIRASYDWTSTAEQVETLYYAALDQR